MRLSDELEFIRALPEEGGLVLVAEREDRDRLREAIQTHCPAGSAARVVFAIVSRQDQAHLVRVNAMRPGNCFPRVTLAETAPRMAPNLADPANRIAT